ncbi:hypothetical protein ACLMJK_006765 [Lecanora helva]
MSTKKPFRKGTVSKGELVFDQNFNPLQSKKASKTISLQSWIANTKSKTLECGNYQGGPQASNRKYPLWPPPHYNYMPSGFSSSTKDNFLSTALSSGGLFIQPENASTTLPNHVDMTQDELSEAMDTSSGNDDDDSVEGDDMSENMDMSSGPEAYELSDKETPTKTTGLTKSNVVNVKVEPDLDDGSDSIFSNKAENMVPKVLTLNLNSRAGIDTSSNATSTTPRMSSTPSGRSGPSSHTSAGPSNLNDSVEETFESLKAPIRASSLSSELSPAKSTTPPTLKPLSSGQKLAQNRNAARPKRLRFSDLRARTSIPTNMSSTVLAQQGIHAAYSSRLNPFSLHPDEYKLLRDHICHLHVSAYLNIRNRILRLWVRNPLVSVTAEEAAGCALSSRWLGLAEVAYEWLVRKGYINFGCVEPPDTSNAYVKRYKSKRSKRKTIVVVGAGMSGLGCARQLESLIEHYKEKWTSKGEETPKVILLEGRNRIGGRVYSHPLKDQKTSGVPDQKRSTAELGAHIIIGFDHGNPLNMIIRGQLALHYHALKDNSTLHDIDGHVVDEDRDTMVEKLYNDCLDRASVYRHRVLPPRTVEGDKALIESGRDPNQEGGPSISAVEDNVPSPDTGHDNSTVESVPGGMDKLTGKAHMITGPRKKQPPARAAEGMGWKLSSNVLAYHDLNLDVVAKGSSNPTLGGAMDEAVKQYQFLLDLSPQDMRLLNWHYANLEYANAANVGKLSLGGWDQDAGNEFEGVHAQVIGGYQQVPRGILHFPIKLDLRTRKAVKHVTYDCNKKVATAGTRIVCEDGEVFEADHVVLTTSLGVLKNETIKFEPPLPDWKLGPIRRLGFGILNKLILVYDKPFWDVNQDMFGLLREPEVKDSLDQEDYVANRGRFYFFWNCVKTTGRPVLISLMAGDAAHQAETTSDADLVKEVTFELSKIFSTQEVPEPLETIVTRWGKDRFTRGSYSYVGDTSLPGDYETLAAPVGTLHFAGEATCATHPATVHGAYISGLRAAAEIIDELIGPIEIPNPLVSWPTQVESEAPPTPQKFAPIQRSHAGVASHIESRTPLEPEDAKQARLEAFENEILNSIYEELGLRPSPPGKPGSNPFLLFTTDVWAETKKACDEARIAATGSLDGKASRNEVRARIGQLWRAAPEEMKRPYSEKTESNRRMNEEQAATFEARLASWDEQAMEVRRKYVREHPGVLSKKEEQDMWKALGVFGDLVEAGEERRAKKMSGYADHD